MLRCLWLILLSVAAPLLAQPAAPLRVAQVRPAAVQPAATDPATIWAESFDDPVAMRAHAFDYGANPSCVVAPGEGLGGGGALRITFAQGQVEAGGIKALFGRNPWGRGARHDETFREIWWRQYLRHEPGWVGNPAKLSRALCMAGADWSQGLMAHVWGGKELNLCLDPASGITDSVKRSTRYNDFDHLRWLGYGQGTTPIFATAESGRWWCVEAHVKLNTPGQADGQFELWLDGRAEVARRNLDWHGTWGDYAINAVFFENYWNAGSPRRQSRWFDELVIATRPIGPLVAAWPLSVTRTAGTGAWELQVVADVEGAHLVWQAAASEAVTISTPPELKRLEAGTYWCRVRSVGGDWSAPMAPFRLTEP